MPGAGELRERLRFESPTSAADDYGNTTEGWTSELVVSASIQPIKGGESVMAARLSGTQPVVIRVRRSSDTLEIGTDWRAVDTRSGAVYAIKSPPADMDRRRQYLDILAESGVAA